ncbi:MAG TPA: hypothetical protein VER37_01345, partial [Thermomicrobiales bacterium]|nr:hypothetical protein [Thermomicrobiales bacterium]
MNATQGMPLVRRLVVAATVFGLVSGLPVASAQEEQAGSAEELVGQLMGPEAEAVAEEPVAEEAQAAED